MANFATSNPLPEGYTIEQIDGDSGDAFASGGTFKVSSPDKTDIRIYHVQYHYLENQDSDSDAATTELYWSDMDTLENTLSTYFDGDWNSPDLKSALDCIGAEVARPGFIDYGDGRETPVTAEALTIHYADYWGWDNVDCYPETVTRYQVDNFIQL